MKARSKETNIVKVLRGKKPFKDKILYLVQIASETRAERKISSDKNQPKN